MILFLNVVYSGECYSYAGFLFAKGALFICQEMSWIIEALVLRFISLRCIG